MIGGYFRLIADQKSVAFMFDAKFSGKFKIKKTKREVFRIVLYSMDTYQAITWQLTLMLRLKNQSNSDIETSTRRSPREKVLVRLSLKDYVCGANIMFRIIAIIRKILI